jgi:cell division septation protein DedD
MSRITTFEIPLRPEELRPPIFAGAAEMPLAEPLQALVTAISRRTADASVTVYLCADDDSARARDDFAMALARTLTAHVPSTLLIDCDFLHPGLSDQMPQKDALGFLDYLLYGSSIGVITQDFDGVHMVGAGSFPVTKRMPFAENAFVDASKRLVTHARCALFVGPAFDGDGGRHPLTGAADVVATVRTSMRHPRLDSIEEQIAALGPELWSIRLTGATAPEPVAVSAPAPPPPVRPARRPAEPPVQRRVERPVERAVPAPPASDMLDETRASASLAPRIAVILFGLLVIAFVVWWFTQNRNPGNLTGDKPQAGEVTTDSTRVTNAGESAPRDTTTIKRPATTTPASDTTATKLRPATPPPATSTSPETTTGNSNQSTGRSGGTVLVSSADIQVMEDLNRRFRGWYMIHISSFQTSTRARDEVAFLESHEFPVFIVFLDLGPKGKWYRVYAGPFETREEAADVKKNLDAVPQVRFTRIATIPD